MSLSRVEAQTRAAHVAVTGYLIELDLRSDELRFSSRTTIEFTADATPTFVDVAPHALRSVSLNGATLGVDQVFDPAARRLSIRPSDGANRLVVDAVMAYSHDGEGLHRHVDPSDGLAYLYAMSFLDAAPRWFACFDQPDLKAPVTIEVSCPPQWRVAGNGPAVEVEPGRWRVTSTGPLATYFTTIVAGPYHEVRDVHDGIALVLHARRSLAEHLDRDAGELFAHTSHSFDVLHELFGFRYPWGEYHQAFVPEFNAGAMENPGCVTLRDTLVFRSRVTDADRLARAVTVAHEMAHMWFGDLVTMRWWDDLWLNESFAEYLGHRVIGDESWVEFGIGRKSWGYRADRRPSTHPVAGNGAADAAAALSAFDGISYAKGASVIRQFAAYAGDEVFLSGLRGYVAAHAGANAEFADLMSAWQRAGAPDLAEWARRWLGTTGLDTLGVVNGVLVRDADPDVARSHRLTVASYAADGQELGRQQVSVTSDRSELSLPSGAVVLPDAGNDTWAKLTLPDTAWLAMPSVLPGVADPLARVSIWTAAQLAVADAELDPGRALGLVAAALPTETDEVIIAALGTWAARTARTYRPDVPAALSQLCTAALIAIEAAAPGSGRQLAAARIVIDTSNDVERLGSWLDDRDVPAGLVVDTELRWALLTRLAGLGALDAERIDAEAAADPTSQGAVHAARCRAARPDAAAKADAWSTMMTNAAAPNYELYAAAEGFWDPTQRTLTEPYVARFFAEIGGTASLRSGWVVDRLALMAYPWTAAEASTLSLTEKWLAEPGRPVGLRRSVADAGDDLRRAVAARARFG